MPGFLAEALTWADNRHYAVMLKTARAWGVPPLLVLTGADAGWNRTNRLLAQALTVLEEEVCAGCRTPLWWAYSTDNQIQFEVKTTTCHSCAKLQQHRDRPNRKPSPGEVAYIRPYNVYEDKPLPSRRESYTRGGK